MRNPEAVQNENVVAEYDGVYAFVAKGVESGHIYACEMSQGKADEKAEEIKSFQLQS